MTIYDESVIAKVFDSVTDPFAIYDRNFKIIKANQALMDLFELTAEELIGRSCHEVFYQRSAVCDDCHVQEVFQTGEPRMLEKFVSLPDGSKRIFEVHSYPIKDHDGSVTQAAEHARDISERKRLESQLQESERFNEKIINSITDSLIVVDPKTYFIRKANDSFHSRVGLEAPHAVGMRCHEIMLDRPTPCAECGIQCPMETTIRTKRPALSDKVYPNAVGEDRLLEVATYPLFNPEGEMNSIIRLERDVTEKRKMEEALAFRSKELQKTQHQLETLFEISRQVSAKTSLPELLDFVQQIGQEIFPNSNLLLFLLDGEKQRFLNLEECDAVVIEPLFRALQRLEQSDLLSDFVLYLRDNPKTDIVSPEYSNDILAFLRLISKDFPNWFSFPISTPNRCIGYFLMGSAGTQDYSREDLRFFQNLFRQIAGDIHHLVHHETEMNRLRQEVVERTSRGEIIGHSDEMQKIYELIDLVSGSDATVLITGENGTGKELVATRIYLESKRREKPFVKVNCPGIPHTLFESELFGHVKGAFTGAVKDYPGKFVLADGGTIFLDEIGDLPLDCQAKLLRVLETGEVETLGSVSKRIVDVRVICASNQDLQKLTDEARFRQDLFYRISVFVVEVPPLRDRLDDIPLLVGEFLKRFDPAQTTKLSAEAFAYLTTQHYPGNIRQLKNIVERLTILFRHKTVEVNDLMAHITSSPTSLPPHDLSLSEKVIRFEKHLIQKTMENTGGNISEAARLLKIDRANLSKKIKEFKLKDS